MPSTTVNSMSTVILSFLLVSTVLSISTTAPCLNIIKVEELLKKTDSSLTGCEKIELGRYYSQEDVVDRLTSELLKNNTEIAKFQCCLNTFTTNLKSADKSGDKSNVTRYANEMVSCAVTGSSSSQPPTNFQKFAWLQRVPPVVKQDVMDHVKCRNPKNSDDSCCARKYHNKVELQLIQDCLHEAMLCEVKKKPDCLQKWKKCFLRTTCTTNTKTLLHYRTDIASLVMTCSQQQTTMRDVIDCTFKQTPKLAAQQHRYAYCHSSVTNKFTTTNTNKYLECLKSSTVKTSTNTFSKKLTELLNPVDSECDEGGSVIN